MKNKAFWFWTSVWNKYFYHFDLNMLTALLQDIILVAVNKCSDALKIIIVGCKLNMLNKIEFAEG